MALYKLDYYYYYYYKQVMTYYRPRGLYVWKVWRNSNLWVNANAARIG